MENQVISKSAIGWDKVVPAMQVGQPGQVGQKPVAHPFCSADLAAPENPGGGGGGTRRGWPLKGHPPFLSCPGCPTPPQGLPAALIRGLP